MRIPSMRQMFLAAVTTFLVATGPTPLQAENLYVDGAGICGGQSPCYTTIQAGISAANAGDTVQVLPGTYNEDISLKSGIIVQGAGAATTTIDGSGTGPTVTAVNVDSAAKIDGFTITGGGCASCRGGGISNNNSSPQISHLVISGNSAIDGAGIFNSSASSPTISNTTISGNTSTIGSGGGIYIDVTSTPTVTDCIISGNYARDLGGGIFVASDVTAVPVITKCTITGNDAFYGGGIFNAHNSRVLVTQCSITSNTARNQGAGFYTDGIPDIRNCTISGNTSASDGGGLYAYDNSRPTVTNTLIAENRTQYGRGAGIFCKNAAVPRIINCDILRNAGVAIYSSAAAPIIINSIIASNSGGGIYGSSTSNYNDVWNNSGFNYGGGAAAGANDISANPQFVNATSDYHLQQSSPCIDAGSNAAVPSFLTTDFYGAPRIVDGNADGIAVVDIGIAEARNPLSVTVLVPAEGEALQNGVTLEAIATFAQTVTFTIRQPGDTTGIPIGYENLPATYDPATGSWKYEIYTPSLPDGYYIIFASATSSGGLTVTSDIVNFSIRNWAAVSLFPATPASKAGRTIPIKFSLHVAASVDPTQPFVYNEDLEIRIYKASNPTVPLQVSVFGKGATDYRIATDLYITNFKTDKTPATYLVKIFRRGFLIGQFTFQTVR